MSILDLRYRRKKTRSDFAKLAVECRDMAIKYARLAVKAAKDDNPGQAEAWGKGALSLSRSEFECLVKSRQRFYWKD